MPLGIPLALEKEHEQIHQELHKLADMGGAIGEAAVQVAKIQHPHFERENEFLPVIGVARELAEGKSSPDFSKAIELANKFRAEYQKLLQEHVQIGKVLDEPEKIGRRTEDQAAIRFVASVRL